MPPPATIPSDATGTAKSSVKDNLSHPEFKDPNSADYDGSTVSSSTQTTSKITQHKVVKTQRTSYASDGLETGSDSDVAEDTGSMYARSKYLSNLSSPTNRLHDRNVIDHDQASKIGPVHMMKDTRYNVKPSVSTMLQPAKEDIGKDNTRDILANYETPFLSEFTRRLSSRSLHSVNSPSALSGLKSRYINREEEVEFAVS